MTQTRVSAIAVNDGRRYDVPIAHVYFAFARGRLSYDCVTCGAHCCRGFGYTAHGAEIESQMRSASTVAWFLEPAARSDGYVVHNAPPACFFLRRDGLCAVQAERGYDQKPETCRLFPFNNVAICNGHLIVAPHDALCPIAFQRRDESATQSTHVHLLAEMASAGIRTRLSHVSPSIDLAIGEVLRRERTVVDLSDSMADDLGRYDAFVVRQLSVDMCLQDGPESRARCERELARYVAVLREVIGGELPEEDGDLATRFCLATPFVRYRLLFDKRIPRPLGPERLSRCLFVFHLLAGFARQAGQHTTTYQTIAKLCRTHLAFAWTMAHVDEVMVWSPSAQVERPALADSEYGLAYFGVVKALQRWVQRRSGLTLGHILAAHVRATSAKRAVILRALSQQVYGRIMPIARMRLCSTSLRSGLQQLITSVLSARTLLVAVERKQGARAGRGVRHS